MLVPDKNPRSLKQHLRAIPVLGTILAWGHALVRLPAMRARHEELLSRIASLENTLEKSRPPAVAHLDRFYVDFENTFRGSRDDIKGRLTVYLPRLAHLFNQKKTATPIAVDVGCGRGEWLELMGENGINAIGIDMNADMVAACRERGLQAQCDDAISYLRSRAPGSLALVTGFHIIEHLSFETLLALFDAAFHALRPDGCIIFETPNPENLRVGACSFYTDPTHIHPIVPQVAEFMARQRGFAEAEIVRLHPHAASEQLHENTPAAALLNQALFGARDFSVIAWKNHRP